MFLQSLQYIGISKAPIGFTYYVTTKGDNIDAGTYRDGDELILTQSFPVKDFQLLEHWYLLGARGKAFNFTINDRLSSYIVAPATPVVQSSNGNCNKINIAQNKNMIVPVNDNGSYFINLSDKLPNTNILKAVPIPSITKTGWFDFDYNNNEIIPNFNQQGGYNLFDFEFSLFCLANNLMLSDFVDYITEGMLAKLIFNQYKLRFSLQTQSSQTTVAIEVHTLVKRNI